MPDLAARFGRLAAEYDARKAAATALVARRDWYTWPGLDLRPLHFERDLLRPGRRLGARPPVDRDVLRIGFDAEGRFVMVEEYSGFLRGRLYYETFLRYGEDVVEAAHFDRSGPIYLHEYAYEGGLMRTAAAVARAGSGRESYTYDGDRISRVEVEHDGLPRSVLSAEHDDRGLVRLVESAGRGRWVRYERPADGFDLDAACRHLEGRFVESALAAVAQLPADGPVAGVALAYRQARELSFEVVIVGADEQAALRAVDATAAWAPAEFDNATDLDLDEPEPLRTVRQELTLLDGNDYDACAGSEAGRRLLCAVAARLNAHNWSHALPVTDDFVVYAVDLEVVDLERNLAECLPPDRLARLRERGLL
ncbi:hypothetical protein Val02_48710 [Virgisporangium aliadipatigenens]|uniref:Uncharacterized protein n=1 Tax=Virgisporangium aliadipatigenens TaxID=741659 RepID=A0A8J3YQ69_9ACTN|nr:hypothetical protein [Virgisporangium aliadipatigenens]GIJ47985.1 hypothetical protein Val02_48710 [Virgisporangium aliadipatigenens]